MLKTLFYPFSFQNFKSKNTQPEYIFLLGFYSWTKGVKEEKVRPFPIRLETFFFIFLLPTGYKKKLNKYAGNQFIARGVTCSQWLMNKKNEITTDRWSILIFALAGQICIPHGDFGLPKKLVVFAKETDKKPGNWWLYLRDVTLTLGFLGGKGVANVYNY